MGKRTSVGHNHMFSVNIAYNYSPEVQLWLTWPSANKKSSDSTKNLKFQSTLHQQEGAINHSYKLAYFRTITKEKIPKIVFNTTKIQPIHFVTKENCNQREFYSVSTQEIAISKEYVKSVNKSVKFLYAYSVGHTFHETCNSHC